MARSDLMAETIEKIQGSASHPRIRRRSKPFLLHLSQLRRSKHERLATSSAPSRVLGRLRTQWARYECWREAKEIKCPSRYLKGSLHFLLRSRKNFKERPDFRLYFHDVVTVDLPGIPLLHDFLIRSRVCRSWMFVVPYRVQVAGASKAGEQGLLSLLR